MPPKREVNLRCYNEDDLEFIHVLLCDPKTKKYFPLMYTKDMEQSKLRLKMRLFDKESPNNTRFVIEDAETQEAVGEVSGHPLKEDPSTMNLAIIIHRKYRDEGYAKAGAMKFIEKIYKERPEIEKFRMIIAESNRASKGVAKRLNFSLKKITIREDAEEKMELWEDK